MHDKKTGEPVPYIPVAVKGTALGATTDLDGGFAILNVEPGTYVVSAFLVGYERVDLPGVQVVEGEVSILEFELEQVPVQLEPIMVY